MSPTPATADGGHALTAERSLTFLATPWTVVAAVLAWLIVAGLSYVAWRRSGFRTSIACLETLRLVILAMVGVILNQPEWVETFRPKDKPTITVLLDSSASMTTRDVVDANSPTAPPATRTKAIEMLAHEETWKPLAERFNVVVQRFAAPEAGSGTNLNAPLTGAPEKFDSLGGIVLASDGDWNDGDPPVDAAVRLRRANVPGFAVPVGSPQR